MNTCIPHSGRARHGFAAAIAAAACATSVSAQIEYEFFLVDAWYTTYSLRECYMTEINNANVACGSATNLSGLMQGFIWTEATEKTAISCSAPKGLNIHNVVVDNDFVLDTNTNQRTTLPGHNGTPQLSDINDNGLVIGRDPLGGGPGPYLWDAVNGARTLTGVPNAANLVRLNNAGQLLGHIINTTNDWPQAFIYDLNTSTWVNLGEGLPPNWLAGHPVTTAYEISAAGAAVGRASWGQEPTQGFLWQPGGVRTFLPALEDGWINRVYPTGVNSSNVVVGQANISPTASADGWRAFVWDEVNGMRNVNDLAILPPNFILDKANRINDNGWIVGVGHFGPGWGTARGFVLKPIIQACYANCDQSSNAPILNVDDFTCFINEFAAAQSLPHTQQIPHYANCDGSTNTPVLNVDDFTCFINAFAAGCR